MAPLTPTPPPTSIEVPTVIVAHRSTTPTKALIAHHHHHHHHHHVVNEDPLHLSYTMTSTATDDLDDCCSNDDYGSVSVSSQSTPLPRHHADIFRRTPLQTKSTPLTPTTNRSSGSSGSKRQLNNSSSNHSNSTTVRVNVGGEAFVFPRTVFEEKFIGLPWKVDSQGEYCLNSASAAVFEVLLDYALFGTMPAYDTMSKDEFQEFETIALGMGGLTTLIEHFDRKDSYLAKELRQGNSNHSRRNRRRRHSTTTASSSCNNNISNYDRHFLINPEKDTFRSNPNSISATRLARFLGVLCGVAESMRGGGKQQRRSSPPSTSSNSGPTSPVKPSSKNSSKTLCSDNNNNKKRILVINKKY